MPGKVVNIKPYGAFIDLQGATGLLHIKEISGARIESLNNIFEVGQEIKVVIKQIDEYQNRICLFRIKALEEYSGENLEKLGSGNGKRRRKMGTGAKSRRISATERV